MPEIALTLVAIGLLSLALVSVNSVLARATAKKLAAELRDIENMLYVYKEKYKAVPGDDQRASLHLTGALSSLGSDNDLIEGSDPWASPAMTKFQESALFWNHVRLAGMAPGDPRSGKAWNAVRGSLGITSSTAIPTRPAGVSGLYSVCSSKINGRLAQMIDIELDDGDATTGGVWAAAETNANPVVVATPTTPYVTAKSYTVCMAI